MVEPQRGKGVKEGEEGGLLPSGQASHRHSGTVQGGWTSPARKLQLRQLYYFSPSLGEPGPQAKGGF